MSHCSFCQTMLNSTKEAAQMLGVSDSRVRGVLARHPERLQGSRVGWGWIVPAKGVKEFRQQSKDGNGQSTISPTCPGCGERLLSTRQAAGELHVSVSRVHAILARDPERLQAFRVGHRWVVPESGVRAYRDRQRLFAALTDNDNHNGDLSTKIEIVVKPEVCHCAAYPFPHRKGGGQCDEA